MRLVRHLVPQVGQDRVTIGIDNVFRSVSGSTTAPTEEPLYFRIDDYRRLEVGRPEFWAATFDAANAFLDSLSLQDLGVMGCFYREAWTIINDARHAGYAGEFVSHKLQEASHLIDLGPKLRQFVQQNNLAFPETVTLEGPMARDIDRREVRIPLHAIILLSKLLCPIWGELIKCTVEETQQAWRELYCLDVITPFLKENFSESYAVLREHFMHNLVTPNLPTWYTETLITKDQLVRLVVAKLITKRYVYCDLQFPDTTFLRYTADGVKQAVASLLGATSRRRRESIELVGIYHSHIA